MKNIELNADYAYDLSELKDNELIEIIWVFLKNKHESQSGDYDKVFEWMKIRKSIKTFAYLFDEETKNFMWAFGNNHNKQVINAKTLFENNTEVSDFKTFNPQDHYSNELKQFRSLFELSHILELNEWEFDVLKRLVRCRNKGQFKEDLQKIKDTIDIYLDEYSE